jgi:transposase
MDVIYERCCGIDIHRKTVVACVIVPGPTGAPRKQVRTFGTMTADLLTFADWLTTQGVTHVAMESTGVYWKPVWNLLEDAFTLLLVNAQHIKAVPGRKTDVRDCEWIADLLRHGLLAPSFVPDRPQRELRELTRYRTALIRERAAEINRLQKTLEGANLKLGVVATNIMGVSGRAILAALVAGETEPAHLAQLAQGRLRQKRSQLEQALAGCMGPHQRFLLGQQLMHIEDVETRIADVETRIAAVSKEITCRLEPVAEAVERLDAIPGVGQRTAEVLVAELGTDMTRFPTGRHVASWAGMCPGNDESAGKRRSGRTRKGNPWLRSALVEAAQAAGRSKQTYLGALHQRLVVRRGQKRAVVAVGHAILVTAYQLLRQGTVYEDLGPTYFDERNRQRTQRRLVRRLEQIGFRVTVEPVALPI